MHLAAGCFAAIAGEEELSGCCWDPPDVDLAMRMVAPLLAAPSALLLPLPCAARAGHVDVQGTSPMSSNRSSMEDLGPLLPPDALALWACRGACGAAIPLGSL